MESGSKIIQIGKKLSLCKYCSKPSHPYTTKCNHNDLLSKIEKLHQANALIPKLIETNREVTELANTFRVVAQDTARAVVVCEEMIKELPNGEELWVKFKDKLGDKWGAATLVQGTEEKTNPSSPKSTTPSETESKLSTDQTAHGETTAPDSLV